MNLVYDFTVLYLGDFNKFHFFVMNLGHSWTTLCVWSVKVT